MKSLSFEGQGRSLATCMYEQSLEIGDLDHAETPRHYNNNNNMMMMTIGKPFTQHKAQKQELTRNMNMERKNGFEEHK